MRQGHIFKIELQQQVFAMFRKRVQLPQTPEEWKAWGKEKRQQIAMIYRSAPANKGTVIFGHGYRENHTCMDDHAEAAWADGYHVITYDAIGHDKSQNGHAGYFDRLMQHVDVSHALLLWAEEQAPARPVYFAGHSMGAASPLLLLVHRPELQQRVHGIVPISTPLDVVGTARWNIPGGIYLLHLLSLIAGGCYVPQSFIGVHQQQEIWGPTVSSWCYRGRIPFRVADEFCGNGLLLQKRIHCLKDMPMCAFHGIHDTTARYSEAHKHFGSLPQTEFHSLEGDHYSVLRDWLTSKKIIETTQAWLHKRSLAA